MATMAFRTLITKSPKPNILLPSIFSRSFSSIKPFSPSSSSPLFCTRSLISLTEFTRRVVPSPSLSALRCYSSRATTSSLNDPSPNWNNRPPKETILLDGCDFEHWLIVVEKPDENLTREEIIDGYIKLCASVVGSEEEVRKNIYSVSTRHYYAIGIIVPEDVSYKFKELPNVRWVLPDSYLDVRNKDYGGEPFIDGQAVPYDNKYHEEWVKNNARANDRSRRNDRPRNNDRSRNFERRRENMQSRDSQGPTGNPGPNMEGGLPGQNMRGGPPAPHMQNPGPNMQNGGPAAPHVQNPGPNMQNSGPNYGGMGPNANMQNGGPNYGGMGPNANMQNGGPNYGGMGPNANMQNGGPNYGGMGPNANMQNGGANYGGMPPRDAGPNSGYSNNNGPNFGVPNAGPNGGYSNNVNMGGMPNTGPMSNAGNMQNRDFQHNAPNNGGMPYQSNGGPSHMPNGGYQNSYTPNRDGPSGNAYQVRDLP